MIVTNKDLSGFNSLQIAVNAKYYIECKTDSDIEEAFKFIKKNKIYMFFPGNPCSSFVLTNIIIKSLIEIYNNRKLQIIYDLMDINKVKFNFKSLKRKSFLFGLRDQKSIKVFNNQESSNLKNILYANCLIYYDRTNKLRLYQIND